MKNLVKEAFSSHLTILRIVGLIPFEHHEKLFRYYSAIIYIFVILLLPILCFGSFFSEKLDLDQMSQTAFIAFEIAVITCKYFPFLLYGPEIYRYIISLNKPIFSQNFKKRQEHILDKCNNICRKSFWMLFLLAFISAPFFALAPILLKTGRTPLDIWTPFEKPVGSLTFNLSYIYVVFATLMIAFSVSGYDGLLPGLIYHMTCQVKILKDNLTNLDLDAELELNTIHGKINKHKKKSEIIYNNIKKCIQHHQMIIRFIEDYIHYFAFGTMTQFLGSCFVICMSLYVLTIIEPFSYTFVFSFFYSIAMFIQLFLYCYFGTTLYEESKSISNAVYMGNWYEYDIKSRKLLIILMERANKTILVTTGGVINLTLDAYTIVLKRAYSFYAVLSRYK